MPSSECHAVMLCRSRRAQVDGALHLEAEALLGLAVGAHAQVRGDFHDVTVTAIGVRVLADAIEMYADRVDSQPGRALARTLQELHSANVSYFDDVVETTRESSQKLLRYERWSKEVGRHLSDMSQSIKELRSEVPPADSAAT